jgi:SSS family transporter
MGLWFMRRNRNADDYFRGGGRLPWWAVSLSLYATMFSSITFLAIPAQTYGSDCRYFGICFGILLVAPLVVRWYLPFFRRLNLTSAYEYLEVRFNPACRFFASGAFILFMIARTAIVTYLPAVALSAVVGLDVNVAIVAVTAVTILYCTVGGVEAVIWSDFVQSILLILGTLAIYAFLVAGTDGGWSGFISMGETAGKFKVFDFALDWTQPVFWVTFLGGIVANLASYTSDQCVVQRYMTTKDEKSAAKSIVFNSVVSFVNCIVFFTMGVALWTFFRSNPQFLDVTMAKNDAVFPLFIGNNLPVGVSGVVFAVVAAATMSTLSSNLNAAASAVTVDFYERIFKGRNPLLCGKIATVATGLLGGAFALVLANMEIKSIYDEFQRFLGVLTGGLGCLFFMGIFLKRVTAAGAVTGLLANYAVCFALDRVQFDGKPHILLYGALGMAVCLIVAPLVSVFTKDRK